MIEDFTILPNRRIHPDFCIAVNHLIRPYIPITKQQYDEIMKETAELNSDLLLHISGKLYTFGAADGGYALMRYNEAL